MALMCIAVHDLPCAMQVLCTDMHILPCAVQVLCMAYHVAGVGSIFGKYYIMGFGDCKKRWRGMTMKTSVLSQKYISASFYREKLVVAKVFPFSQLSLLVVHGEYNLVQTIWCNSVNTMYMQLCI